MKNTLKLILESVRIAIDKAIDKAIKGIPQSDYNENDETSMSFIKNRPFYETQETIIFDGDIELDMIGNQGLYAFTDKLNLVAGQEYELVYNDASTKFIAKENSTHFPMAGMNISVSTDNICIEYPTTVNGHLIIKIPSTIKQIDEKYLPAHNHDDKYCTQYEIDAMEFITTDDIDTICGASIVSASEVMF